MKDLRLLKPNEIDVRVGSINEKGATLLLYKDARVDMNILDESGLKWKRSHELINGNLFCTISIWDEDLKDWISRQDVGVESQSEKEKGQASDAFKRAGFNFGIGRELYTAPFTWISSDKYNGFVSGKTPQGKDKYSTYDKFVVTKIGYDTNKEINTLEIKNQKTSKVVFTMGAYQAEDPAGSGQTRTTIPAEETQQDILNNLLRQHGHTEKEDIQDFLQSEFGIKVVNGKADLTKEDVKFIIEALDTKGQ